MSARLCRPKVRHTSALLTPYLVVAIVSDDMKKILKRIGETFLLRNIKALTDLKKEHYSAMLIDGNYKSTYRYAVREAAISTHVLVNNFYVALFGLDEKYVMPTSSEAKP